MDNCNCSIIEKEGDPSLEDPVLPVLIPIPDKDGEMQKITAAAAGGTCGGHTVCITSSGEVWAWGKNNFGQTARVAIAHRKNVDRMIPQKSMLFVGVYCRRLTSFYSTVFIWRRRSVLWGISQRCLNYSSH